MAALVKALPEKGQRQAWGPCDEPPAPLPEQLT